MKPNRLKNFLFFLVFLLNTYVLSSQTEWANIPLDNMRGSIEDLQQFSDDEGNLLLQIKGPKSIHFGLIRPDRTLLHQSFKLRNPHYLIESLYDEKHFVLFYEKPGDRHIYQYRTGKRSMNGRLLKTDVGGDGEKSITNAFVKDDFLIFNYSKSPFTLHSYRYDEQRHFEKESQVFQSDKNEFFWGKINTGKDVIIVQFSRKPLTMHLYRYISGSGFEKKSFKIRPIYEAAGITKNGIFAVGENDINQPISAHIDGDDIYVDMEPLLGVFSLKAKRKRPYPGVLRLNWEKEEGQLLTFGSPLPKFKRRSVAMLDSLYFQLLINKKQLDLMIYNVKDQRLVKKHSYNKHELDNFVHGPAQMEKEWRINMGGLGVLPFYNERNISSKKALKEFAKGNIFMDVSRQGDLIEIRISGANEKAFDTTARSGFISYLSDHTLGVKKMGDQASVPKWTKIERYLKELEGRGELGEYLIYDYQGGTYLAYVDELKEVCKIIAF